MHQNNFTTRMASLTVLAVALALPATATSEPTEESQRLGVGLKAALFVPAARTGPGELRVGEASVERAMSWAGALDLLYSPPVLGNALSARLEAGYSPLAGVGEASFPADPDFDAFQYSWDQNLIPITLGIHYEQALALPVGSLYLAGGAGGAVVPLQSVTTYEKDGTSVQDAPQTAVATGFYAALEMGWRLGPGLVLGEYRFVLAKTDMNFRETYGGHINTYAGEVQGSLIRLGYRIDFDI